MERISEEYYSWGKSNDERYLQADGSTKNKVMYEGQMFRKSLNPNYDANNASKPNANTANANKARVPLQNNPKTTQKRTH